MLMRRNQFFLALSLTFFLLMGSGFSNSLESISNQITQKYPQISHITPSTLNQWLKTQPGLVIVDVRSSEEFQVSHLQNAQHIVNPEAIALSQDDLIVVYCAVGYRASIFAEKLQKRNFTNVHNLKGGIFAWVNKNLPVYQGSQLTHQVHTYNHALAELVKPQYRSEF